jgi:hypothetical protein
MDAHFLSEKKAIKKSNNVSKKETKIAAHRIRLWIKYDRKLMTNCCKAALLASSFNWAAVRSSWSFETLFLRFYA